MSTFLRSYIQELLRESFMDIEEDLAGTKNNQFTNKSVKAKEQGFGRHKIGEFSQVRIAKILKFVIQTYGYKIIKFLGKGDMGAAFLTDQKHVLKITVDKAEVVAMQKIQKVNSVHLPKVYRISKIKSTDRTDLFVIEKDYAYNNEQLQAKIDQFIHQYRSYIYSYEMETFRKNNIHYIPLPDTFDYMLSMASVGTITERIYEPFYKYMEGQNNRVFLWFMKEAWSLIRDLRSAGIHATDFHPGNIGILNKHLFYFDPQFQNGDGAYDMPYDATLKENLLLEKISSEVYNFVRPENLLNILKTNTWNLSTHIGTQGDSMNDKGLYFLPLSRSKTITMGYGRSLSGYREDSDRTHSIARIQFDGNKLSSNFKGAPVDYWQRKDYQKLKQQYTTGSEKDIRQRAVTDFEFEDRLYSNQHSINNVTKYINKIDLLIRKDDENLYEVKQIIDLCGKYHIPINVYGDLKDFIAGNKNSFTSDFLNTTITKPEIDNTYKGFYNYSRLMSKVSALVLYDESLIKDYDQLKSALAKLYSKYGLNTPSDNDYYQVHEYMSSLNYNDRDFLNGIYADIHNVSKSGFNTNNSRIFLKMLTDNMLYFKVKSIKDLLFLKRDQILPNDYPKYDWTKKYTFARIPYYPEDPHEVIDNKTRLKDVHRIYTTSAPVSKDEMNKMWEIYIGNKSIGELLNFICNRFTPNKVKEIVKAIGDDLTIIEIPKPSAEEEEQ